METLTSFLVTSDIASIIVHCDGCKVKVRSASFLTFFLIQKWDFLLFSKFYRFTLLIIFVIARHLKWYFYFFGLFRKSLLFFSIDERSSIFNVYPFTILATWKISIFFLISLYVNIVCFHVGVNKIAIFEFLKVFVWSAINKWSDIETLSLDENLRRITIFWHDSSLQLLLHRQFLSWFSKSGFDKLTWNPKRHKPRMPPFLLKTSRSP